MSSLAYRKDIDGLRAVAVIAVVLFHFDVPGFTGGFVGVDVFFVISGYLIASIIWRERLGGRFSLAEFWARRARRILPALFVMILATLVAGWFLLTPRDYDELGRSIHYQVVFTSNLLFARQDGYFETSSDLTPLLHTWSLSIEEQFYVIFPLLLMLLSSRLKHWRTALFLLLLMSFAMSQWAVIHAPQKAFYLLPMRAWELLAGVMLAVMPAGQPTSPIKAQAVSLLSLGLILLAVCGYDSSTPFPGVAALLPVVGVIGLIWANGQQATLAGQVLSNRWLVGVGLISYSWYLWHWPVLVFGKYASVYGLDAWELAGLFILSLVLSYGSWRFVEMPFRERRLLAARRQILVAAGMAIIGLGLVGKSLGWAQGIPWRLSPQALQYAEARTWRPELMSCLSDDKKSDRQFCHFGPRPQAARALVWGDSHAAALIPALEDEARKHGVNITLAAYSGCLPFNRNENTPGCVRFNQRVVQALDQEKYSDVVLAGRWSLYVYGQRSGDTGAALMDPATGKYDRAIAERRFAEGMGSLVRQLRTTGHRVWLVKEVPLQDFSVPYRLSRLAMVGLPIKGEGIPLTEHLKRQAYIDALFVRLADVDPDVRLLDPAPQLCDAIGGCRVELGGRSLYSDDNHLSDVGSRYVEAFLEPLFTTLRNQTVTGRL
ncbi:acyltransferase family protein [Pseudomonas gingeri]|uniref:acyltransferase family protein n=1 Tax=Pseudomonas gingeri TaxID=117681 RepID=UPI0015A31367|nr:acyltransferase family protein [Pseudomonas gingeri]NWA04246.1 acyltransferase [Pseudomonas gingeri]NWA15179.1 acyltransferase [Pseudomonas gingeri]NWA54620.1 acyltransferase [Pseudomonas gingeri]NWA98377.1 acyltransferase [Pseudomonas gingeri]NWB04109.1 acyltransferase [Pseudomonas gingeri]